jgi:cyanophycin synthetase
MIKNPPIIKQVVIAMGGTIEDFVPERGCFYIKVLGKRIMIQRKISITRDSFMSVHLSKYKDLTHKLLCEYNLPTPPTECFYKKTYDRKNAIEKLQKLTYPVIIKDAQGSNSRGIFPFIHTAQEALEVLEIQLPIYRSMVAQQMVFGKEFRLLVLYDKIIGALEMIPPYIVGDGVSSVEELITEKQFFTEKRTLFDEKLNQILGEKGFTLKSVIPKNKGVYIKKSSCLAEGGEMKDVTDLVNKKIENICVRTSEVIGKSLIGIDVICEDISKDPSEQSFNILEINGKPDLYIHYNPKHGKTRNVIEEIIRFMVKIAK